MTFTDTEERLSDRFVRLITDQCLRDRGRRAALRRGLRRPPEQAYTMHAVVAPLLPPTLPGNCEYAYYAVAAMIADSIRGGQGSDSGGEDLELDDVQEATGSAPDQGKRTRHNLGTSLAWAVCRPGKGRRAMNGATAEKRLHLLVRQGHPAVYQQLAGVVRHLSTVEVPVSWGQLIDDLCEWRHHRDRVAKRWLQSYYRTLHQAEKQNLKLEESA